MAFGRSGEEVGVGFGPRRRKVEVELLEAVTAGLSTGLELDRLDADADELVDATVTNSGRTAKL